MGLGMADPIRNRCLDCLVRDSSLCASLRDDELEAMSAIGRRKIVARGATVAWEGDENPICANIVSGAVKLIKSTADGREQAVGLLFDGDFLGQPYAGTSELTAVALGDTEMCVFPRDRFELMLAERPRLERALLDRTMRSLNEARERQLTLARKSARARIAGFLIDLARDPAQSAIELPMSRGDIADYLGLTIETVSRQFTELKSMGLIAAGRGGRHVTLLDRDGLQSIAND